MQHIANPSGLVALESLIHVIENKKKIQDVLDDINKARDEANERIAIVGKVEDIERLASQAITDLSEAAGVLSAAKREAASILTKAGVKSQTEKERQRVASEVLERQEARAADLARSEAGLVEREAVLLLRENEATLALREAKALSEHSAELIAEAEGKLKALREFAAKVD